MRFLQRSGGASYLNLRGLEIVIIGILTRHLFILPKHFGEILTGIRVGYGKSGFRCTKAVISVKRIKIALRLGLLYWAPIGSLIAYVLSIGAKSTTLNDLKGSLCTPFQNTFQAREKQRKVRIWNLLLPLFPPKFKLWYSISEKTRAGLPLFRRWSLTSRLSKVNPGRSIKIPE